MTEKPEAVLIEGLGAERVEALRRAGAVMSRAEAVALLRGEARAVLDEK